MHVVDPGNVLLLLLLRYDFKTVTDCQAHSSLIISTFSQKSSNAHMYTTKTAYFAYFSHYDDIYQTWVTILPIYLLPISTPKENSYYILGMITIGKGGEGGQGTLY